VRCSRDTGSSEPPPTLCFASAAGGRSAGLAQSNPSCSGGRCGTSRGLRGRSADRRRDRQEPLQLALDRRIRRRHPRRRERRLAAWGAGRPARFTRAAGRVRFGSRCGIGSARPAAAARDCKPGRYAIH
jgi:hypothetical protein